MGERFQSILPKDGPPTDFQWQQHEAEEYRMLPQLWQMRRPIQRVRNGWPALPDITSDQMIRFGGGLNHMVRRLYAAVSNNDTLSQLMQVEMMDTLSDMKTIAASAPLEQEST
jgi:hypothetical protein